MKKKSKNWKKRKNVKKDFIKWKKEELKREYTNGRYTLYHSFSCPKFQLPIKSPDVTIFEKQC